jgi:very-short-patch-repair endonuclease
VLALDRADEDRCMSVASISDAGRAFIRNIVEQLIDLSRRNPSLNFRASKSTVALSIPPPEIAGFVGAEPVSVPRLIGRGPSADEEKTLRRLYDRSRLLYEERGVRTLHIALGLVAWLDEASGKSYNAPLMLLPIELQRSGNAYSLRRVEGAEPEPNRALMELLRRHPTLGSPDFEQFDDLDYPTVLAVFRKFLQPAQGAAFKDECHLGLFSYEKLVMVDDIEVNADTIIDHPVIAAMNGDPAPLALLQHGIELPTPADLDRATVSPDRVYVMEADSSQQEALEAVSRGLSLVVQGPPGTGKSQTIVNAIAQALLEGKSVLFVAEKKVALDVVFDRLRIVGLGDAVLAVQRDTDKARFAKMLALRHTEIVSNGVAAPEYRTARSALEELDAYRMQLHDALPAGVTPFQLYGRHGRYASETPLVRIDGINGFDRDALEDLGETVERISTQPSWLRHPDEARWSSLRPEINDLGKIHAAFDCMVECQRFSIELKAVVSEASPMVGEVEIADEEALSRLEQVLGILVDAPHVPNHWLKGSPREAVAALQQYARERAVFDSDRTVMLNRYRDEIFDADASEVAERFLAEYDRFWRRWFNAAYRSDVRNVLGRRLEAHRKAVYREIRDDLALLKSINERRTTWELPDHPLSIAFGGLFRGVESSVEELRSAADWYERFAALRDAGPIDARLGILLCSADPEPRAKARELAKRLRENRQELSVRAGQLQALFHDLPADRRDWSGYLRALVELIEEAPRYCEFRKRVAKLRSAGFQKLLDAIAADERIQPDGWRAVFDRVVDASLIDYAHRTRPALAAFDRESHEIVRNRFRQADEANIESGGLRVKARLVEQARNGTSSPTYREAIDTITHEAKKVRNIMPVRVLARRAFDAIRVLKPCWMMSPLAVSQYLPPGQVFDLVIFDEASQMRPADAIPALSRAKQIVVVGDDKQLPPTSFFDNALAGDESDADEDRADIGDYESILNRCAAVLDQRMLRWHYRSRHESLIAFSNHRFYDDRLVTFPTATVDGNFGVRFVRVDGKYARGGSRQNRIEAVEVARLAYEHARTRPEETLGIVAFSQAQQRAIEDALEETSRAHPQVVDFFSEARPADKRVFVKNLESVQGDERDVMILSIGYGRDEDGKLSYNFGPLNRQGGGRRLNVAVTRAKNQLIVVSSIDDHDLDAEKCREGGASLVRSYLGYARSGGNERATPFVTGRGVDSPFEEDVRLVLSAAGHKVHLQVGASGYRIDLAVCHPEHEGAYVLAVECDGATYHGTPTARDRDRLRDRTLSSFGWRVYRIWSRDWFRRRSAEITRLLAAVDEAIATYNEGKPPMPVPTSEAPKNDARAEEPDPATQMDGIAVTAVFNYLERNWGEFTKRAISEATSLPERLVTSALAVLVEQEYVQRIGVGRGTKYALSRRRR